MQAVTSQADGAERKEGGERREEGGTGGGGGMGGGPAPGGGGGLQGVKGQGKGKRARRDEEKGPWPLSKTAWRTCETCSPE